MIIHINVYSAINLIYYFIFTTGLAEEEIKVYLDEFEQRVEEEILMIGNIPLDDVQVYTNYCFIVFMYMFRYFL